MAMKRRGNAHVLAAPIAHGYGTAPTEAGLGSQR
jgi:hypothetical protein